MTQLAELLHGGGVHYALRGNCDLWYDPFSTYFSGFISDIRKPLFAARAETDKVNH